MDSELIADLKAQLSMLQEREAALARDARSHVANLAETRARLGNPFFYTGRPENARQSKAQFTGYKSHDAGLPVLLGLRRLSDELKSVQDRLRRAGIEVS